MDALAEELASLRHDIAELRAEHVEFRKAFAETFNDSTRQDLREHFNTQRLMAERLERLEASQAELEKSVAGLNTAMTSLVRAEELRLAPRQAKGGSANWPAILKAVGIGLGAVMTGGAGAVAILLQALKGM